MKIIFCELRLILLTKPNEHSDVIIVNPYTVESPNTCGPVQKGILYIQSI